MFITLINFLIVACIFCAIAYGIWWVCVKFQAPKLVFWIAGLILLIFLLAYLGSLLGMHTGFGDVRFVR